MTNFILAVQALPKGLGLCLGHSRIRRLSLWPWVVGIFCYVGSVIGAYHLHPVLLERMVGEPSGFFGTILYGLAWFFVGMLLIVLTLVASVVLVLLFTAIFQTAIAAEVLRSLNRQPPPEAEGFRGIAADTVRSVVIEAAKLIWLLPLMVLVLVFGLIPPFTPVALVIAAWLLAYQFVDIVLEVYRVGARDRFRFARENGFLLVCFGATLSLAWAVPFLGILLPPAAAAGAAWLLSESGLIAPFEAETSSLDK